MQKRFFATKGRTGMGLRTPEEYLKGLQDAREVYYRGERVKDVTSHPELGVAARHASIDFSLAERREYRAMAVCEENSEQYSAYYRVPQSSQDLLDRTQLIALGTELGATLVILIKEIGTDAIFALKRVLSRKPETAERARLESFYRYCREKDLALAVAQTDVKGDRSKRPSEQPDPDLYLRVVEERKDGVVVRGAK